MHENINNDIVITLEKDEKLINQNDSYEIKVFNNDSHDNLKQDCTHAHAEMQHGRNNEKIIIKRQDCPHAELKANIYKKNNEKINEMPFKESHDELIIVDIERKEQKVNFADLQDP